MTQMERLSGCKMPSMAKEGFRSFFPSWYICYMGLNFLNFDTWNFWRQNSWEWKVSGAPRAYNPNHQELMQSPNRKLHKFNIFWEGCGLHRLLCF